MTAVCVSAGSVEIKDVHSKFSRRNDSAGYRIRNIVKLEVEEDLDPLLKDFLDDVRAGSREELKTDLEGADLIFQHPYQFDSLLLSRNIKSNDQLLGLGIR